MNSTYCSVLGLELRTASLMGGPIREVTLAAINFLAAATGEGHAVRVHGSPRGSAAGRTALKHSTNSVAAPYMQ